VDGRLGQVRFVPLTPARLVDELAEWVRTLTGQRSEQGAVVGFDGPAQVGTTGLADQVGEVLRSSGLPVARATTSWWWRPAALRLELGRQDVDMLLTGWVDSDALNRELLEPLRSRSPYLTRLRDPGTDRSVRQQYAPWRPGTVLLMDGPFLLAAGLRLDAVVGFSVSAGALGRALPPDRSWWLPGFDRYQEEYEPLSAADLVLSYDHPSAPAAAGLAQVEADRR
jgi:hypothetical protein